MPPKRKPYFCHSDECEATDDTEQTAGLYARGPKQILKAVDVTNNQNYTNAGQFTLLNGTAQGTSYYQRAGRRQINAFLDYNIAVLPIGTAAPGDYIRTMIVYDRQSNQALPAVADLLLGTSATGGTTSSPLTFINYNNRERFKILFDKNAIVPQQGTVTTTNYPNFSTDPNNEQTLIYKGRLNLHGLITQYDGATSTIPNITTGAIFLFAYATFATANWQSTFDIRTWFIEEH